MTSCIICIARRCNEWLNEMILFLVKSSESRREITMNVERLWKLEHIEYRAHSEIGYQYHRVANGMGPILQDSKWNENCHFQFPFPFFNFLILLLPFYFRVFCHDWLYDADAMYSQKIDDRKERVKCIFISEIRFYECIKTRELTQYLSYFV